MRLFLRCVAESIAEVGFKGLAEMIPGGSYAYSVAEKTLEKWRKNKRAKQEHDEFLALAQATIDDVRNQVAEIVSEVVAQNPQATPPTANEIIDLKLFLEGVPASVRQSLRRVEDPSGTTIPANFDLKEPDDVVKVLPQRPPRFRPNDAVPGKSGWVLERLLGTGGFGEVWFAKHKSMASLSGAIKFCFGQTGRDLIHEADLIDRVMSAGSHPNIVPLKDAHLEGESPWLMYEYVGGGDLTNWIHTLAGQPTEKRLPQVIAAIRQLCDAVSTFHQLPRPIVHRDLKPSNILLNRASKKLQITDFGIGSVTAKATNHQHSRGQSTRGGLLLSYLRGSHTPIYSSPQQRRGDSPDTRDDVHALGVIAYQMLTGRLDAGPGTGAKRQLERCGASVELVEMVLNCASEELEDRPENAGAIRLGADVSPTEILESETAKTAVAQIQTEWDFAISGLLWHKKRNHPNTDWVGMGKTPAVVEIEVDSVYKWGISYQVTDGFLKSFEQVAKLANLTNLVLLGCERVTDAGLVHVAKLNNLTHLNLRGCKGVTDAGLVHLAKLNNLTDLNLVSCEGVADAGLVHLAKLNNLTHLNIGRCKQITDAGLVHLAKLNNLTYLNLEGCEQISNTGLVEVAKLHRLTELNIQLCKRISDEGLVQIANLVNLTNLNIVLCGEITDAGLVQIAKLTNLTRLEFKGNDHITDAGLVQIAKLTKLTTLYLHFCKQLTDAGIARLQRALPNCAILR